MSNYNYSGKDTRLCDCGSVLWPLSRGGSLLCHLYYGIRLRGEVKFPLLSLSLSLPIIRAICFISRSRTVAAGIFNTSYTHWWVTSLIRHRSLANIIKGRCNSCAKPDMRHVPTQFPTLLLNPKLKIASGLKHVPYKKSLLIICMCPC